SPEGRHIFGNLTVMENLKLATYSRRKDADLNSEYERIFELFPRLKERRDQRSESLSGGEQQMLAVGRALMTGCRLLLLDEPSMGLAPVLKYELFRKLKQLNEEGMTILLVEQNANLALHLAHRGYVLDTGNIVAEGTGQQLLENPEVKKAYLGG
ncbi:MAG: ATP-binding cassette domain-containing protein, partial [Desulfuromonadales bacterium]